MSKSKSTIVLALVLVLNTSFASADAVSDRITVTVHGTGPDVILVPGLASSNAVWDATVKRFEGHYRLHVVQVAGFAGSPSRGNAQGAVVQPTVDALDAYVKASKLKSPAVIGHSMGGLMGMMLAVQHPEDVGKLMIVDSLPFFGNLMGAKDAAECEPRAAMMRDTILNESKEAYAAGETNFMRVLIKSPEGLKQTIKWAIASDKSVVGRAMYEVMTTDLRPKLHEITVPVTMLYPFDSAMRMEQAEVDKMYQENFASLPNKKLVRIDESFHFIMLDQPEKFGEQVTLFLK